MPVPQYNQNGEKAWIAQEQQNKARYNILKLNKIAE